MKILQKISITRIVQRYIRKVPNNTGSTTKISFINELGAISLQLAVNIESEKSNNNLKSIPPIFKKF